MLSGVFPPQKKQCGKVVFSGLLSTSLLSDRSALHKDKHDCGGVNLILLRRNSKT
jgi:hypothetical protein